MNALHPTVWRTCRVLSNEYRLKLLWKLFQEGESSVTALGHAVGLQEPVASSYLRALNARGLISSERRMKYVFYKPDANPEVEHADLLLAALRASYDAFMPLSMVAAHMTAFTHPRRMDIVRALKEGVDEEMQLAVRTAISPPALYRHIRKLVDRGYVQKNGREVYLVEQKDVLPRVLLSIVLG